MNVDELLIRMSAWLALALYTASEITLRQRSHANSRLAWSLSASGWGALLIHIFFAFHFRYHWNHSAAYDDTARQTAAFTGWNSGVGIYINYLFALIWLADLVRSRPKRTLADHRRPAGWWLTRGIFLFMFLNGGVIFVSGAMKWIGLLACVALIFTWLLPRSSGRIKSHVSADGVKASRNDRAD